MRCLVVDDDAMSRAVMEHFIAQHGGLDLVASCEDAIEASKVLRQEEVDLIFLDVEMPGMSGLELVKSLERRPSIILVTAKEDYAIEAFDIDVTDYLLKPVSYARFLKAVQRVERQQDTSEVAEEQEYVFVKTEGRLVKLDLSTVRWIEAEGDYLMIYTQEKKYLVHSTMKGIEKKLPTGAFARVHRSFIVRIDQMDDIADASIVIGRKVVPIGASYKSELLKRLKMI